MSNELTTTTEQNSSAEPSHDIVIGALSDAYQEDIIDERTYGDLVEHRLETGMEPPGRAEFHDRLEWAAVYCLLAFATLSAITLPVSAAAVIVTSAPTAGAALIGSLLGLMGFGTVGFMALDMKRGGGSD